MSTETKMAVDPITGKRYPIELPTSEVVKQEILRLDYPTHGITKKQATEKLAEKFGLSDEEKKAQTKRGKRYLGFFHYEVVGTEFERLLREGKLKQPGGRRKPYVLSGDVPPPPPPDGDIEEIYQQIRKKIAEDLLQQIKENSPAFFENLVIDLLVKMGYGGSREDAETVGRSGDGGIDGIINQDRLGLDVVYVQAKRWQDNVGAPEIAGFAGALAGQGANKGIFITTSDFTKAAKDYDAAGFKIILIDGKRLAQLMIDHNVGVSTVKTYEIKRVDSDYFIEDTG